MKKMFFFVCCCSNVCDCVSIYMAVSVIKSVIKNNNSTTYTILYNSYKLFNSFLICVCVCMFGYAHIKEFFPRTIFFLFWNIIKKKIPTYNEVTMVLQYYIVLSQNKLYVPTNTNRLKFNAVLVYGRLNLTFRIFPVLVFRWH